MMTTANQDPLSEAGLKTRIEALVSGRRVKVWLVQSDGIIADTRFSVGEELGEPPTLFDQGAGFYLLGEAVPPDLLKPLHQLFEEFCHAHRAVPEHARHAPIVTHYRAISPSHSSHRHQVSMHYPFSSFGPFHTPMR
jgi:hypothetical protein